MPVPAVIVLVPETVSVALELRRTSVPLIVALLSVTLASEYQTLSGFSVGRDVVYAPGTLARLIASAEAEFVAAGLAIDEDTVLVVGEGALEVRGTGSVWRVMGGDDDSVSVATMGA